MDAIELYELVMSKFQAEFIVENSIPEPMSGCWLWTGRTSPAGYGSYARGLRKTFPAHRISWMIYNYQYIPKGMFICHKCDVPACVNPKHLYCGTPATNARDAVRRHRLKPFRADKRDI